MIYRVLADIVMVTHLLFIIYVVGGGFLVWKWPWTMWLHIPCAIYGVLIEFVGWICPLTPLENHFRTLAGQSGYAGGYIEHYLLPIIYPSGLTKTVQIVLGTTVIVVNLFAYTLYLMRMRSR